MTTEPPRDPADLLAETQATRRAQAARTTRAADHQFIEEPDYVALPRLLHEGVRADLVYIDDNDGPVQPGPLFPQTLRLGARIQLLPQFLSAAGK